jgi:alkylation response protein AidB-like acyl-CoA dehydrogenase
MDYVETVEERRFRAEVREWLNANKPKAPRTHDIAEQIAHDKAWQRKQYDGGWAGISWPKEYGGRGLSPVQQLIWCEEYASNDCPLAQNLIWLGLNHAGPTLIVEGTDAQKGFHLPKILKGETIWCQGFSEPGAGSDMANLRTRGVVDGDHLVVNGQKIWTSFAHTADYQELLVRTGTQESRHRELTWVICDMRTPGVEVRPIVSLDGHPHCCEVFYDNVRIPLSNVVGEINGGWSVAMTTFRFERGSASFGGCCEVIAQLEDLIEYAGSHPGPYGGRPAIADEHYAYRLAMCRAQAQAMRSMMYRMVSSAELGLEGGSEGSMMRLAYTELGQSVMRLAMEILGPDGLSQTASPRWTQRYYTSFYETIAGGTSEVQRNIIGERVLGLPR